MFLIGRFIVPEARLEESFLYIIGNNRLPTFLRLILKVDASTYWSTRAREHRETDVRTFALPATTKTLLSCGNLPTRTLPTRTKTKATKKKKLTIRSEGYPNIFSLK